MISYMHRKEAKWLLIGGIIGYLLRHFNGVDMLMNLVNSFL